MVQLGEGLRFAGKPRRPIVIRRQRLRQEPGVLGEGGLKDTARSRIEQ